MPVFPELRPARITSERVALLDDVALQRSNLWRFDLVYTLLWSALLLWAGLNPRSYWLAGTAAASPASLVMGACAILSPLLIPFVVYFPLSQAKGHFDSFSSIQVYLSRTTRGYLRQVVACSLLTLIPLLSVYVMFALMTWLGFITSDLLIPVILGRAFLIFVVSFSLLASTTAIGLAMSDSRALRLIATAIAVSAVTMPFIFSELVTGTRFESHLVRFIQALGNSIAPSVFLLLASLLIGSCFSWLYGRKRIEPDKNVRLT